MDYRVMKRPMFKMGGPTSGGTGITSGLETPRQNYNTAGLVDFANLGTSSEMEKILMNRMINRDQNYDSMMSLPKLQAIGAIASNVLPNVERGGLKGIVDILKDPQTINAAIQGLSQTKKLELQRDDQKLKDMAAIISMKQGREKIDTEKERYDETFALKTKTLDEDIKYKSESLRISEKKVDRELAVEYRNRIGIEAEALIQPDGSVLPRDKAEFERKMKLARGKSFMSEQEVKFLAYKMILNSPDVKNENMIVGSKRFNDAVEDAASSLYYTQIRTEEAEGGRINKQMGGGFDMGQAPQETNLAPMAPQETNLAPQSQDPFTILRSRLPQEISDEVVSLIAYNKKAFADFANIQDQDDVDLFNQKYNVQLVVDLASR